MSDDSDDEYEVFTPFVVSPRCSLCRFTFEEGDMIVADLDGRRSKPYAFVFAFMYHVDTPTDQTIIHAYECDSCVHSTDGPWYTAGYHEDCLDFWGPVLPPSTLREATLYTCTPSLLDDARRRNKIRRFLLNRVPTMLPTAALPVELWSMVVDRLVRICATSTLKELWETRDGSRTEDVEALDCARGIWARYVFIEGVRYFAQLTNAPEPAPAADGRPAATVCLLDGRASATKTVVYVLQDHLGVRQLIFAEAEQDMTWLRDQVLKDGPGTTDERNVLYWSTVQLQPSGRLCAVSDELKIRAVMFRAADGELDLCSRPMVWSIPMAPSTIASLRIVNYTPTTYKDKEWNAYYMASFVCNAPGVTAYSAFCMNGLMAIHAHQPGEAFDFYQHFDQAFPGSGLWVYFALGKGERIAHVFGRRGCIQNYMGLLLQTNRGRNMVVGPAGLSVAGASVAGASVAGASVARRNNAAPRWYRHIYSLPVDTPTRVHYNVSPHGIQKLAFEHAGTGTGTVPRPPVAPATLVRSPGFAKMGMYYASTVDLDGVVRVTPSRKRRPPHFGDDAWVLGGFLFEYADGRPPAAFGEFRLDNTSAAIDLAGVDALHFGYYYDGTRPAHLARVSPRRGGSMADEHKDTTTSMTWYAVPLTGQAEMWFSPFDSVVYHETLDPSYRAVKGQGHDRTSVSRP
ncbi:hypothetical protein SPI_05576 [Niveomyces insectorum RCEF 264]|uniref:Uncharacterized protein n=1 Tax=Niveomyces insectorum RCEF 264 TaxID=1081102 RepID=A0A167TCE0_9HYPO|nr:hypothetical protein SPI_05576 [Niveomyces insectorum RCEF 264]